MLERTPETFTEAEPAGSDETAPLRKSGWKERLVDLLLPTDPSLAPLRPVAHRLTRYAVDFRYPDEWATRRQAQSAVVAAEREKLARLTAELDSL